MLIEGATGIYTGSKYNERRIYEENGFLGELENFEKGTTIAIKNHGMGGLESAGAVLLIMRNPYDAFKAEFNRKQTEKNVDGGRSHVGHADPAGLIIKKLDKGNHFYITYIKEHTLCVGENV